MFKIVNKNMPDDWWSIKYDERECFNCKKIGYNPVYIYHGTDMEFPYCINCFDPRKGTLLFDGNIDEIVAFNIMFL